VRRLPFCGFSLIELMIVLILIAGVLTMAAPSFGDWLAKSRQRNLAKAIDNAINRTRSEAIRRNGRVNLCISANQKTCAQSGGWEQGWIIYPALRNSRTLDVGETIIHHESGGAFHNLTANSTAKVDTPSVRLYLSFLGNGRPQQLGGALQMGTISVCATGQNAINVVMAATGRSRIDLTSTPCP
jgi:type IV fimbrial biogenesis protein FimT